MTAIIIGVGIFWVAVLVGVCGNTVEERLFPGTYEKGDSE